MIGIVFHKASFLTFDHQIRAGDLWKNVITVDREQTRKRFFFIMRHEILLILKVEFYQSQTNRNVFFKIVSVFVEINNLLQIYKAEKSNQKLNQFDQYIGKHRERQLEILQGSSGNPRFQATELYM